MAEQLERPEQRGAARPGRWPIATGADRNSLVIIAGGVALIALFTLVRALGNEPESFGRSANLVTAIALGALVPFIIAVYLAARSGYAELLDDGLRVRVGFLVNAFVPYDDIDVVSGPTKRPRAAYGVSPSYRRHELNLGLLESAVEVRLRRRRRMGTRWLFPFLRVRTLWLGVSEPARFIEELRMHVGD